MNTKEKNKINKDFNFFDNNIIDKDINENNKVENDIFISESEVAHWMDILKKEHKVKGKNLFMGIRVSLTGACHGPDLKLLLPLTKRETIVKRINNTFNEIKS